MMVKNAGRSTPRDATASEYLAALPGTIEQVAARLGRSRRQVEKALNRLTRSEGRVRVQDGVYRRRV